MMGLPSLHALDEYPLGAQRARIWLASEATDMRGGFDRLAERVRAVIGEDPRSGHLFEWTGDCTPNTRRKSPLSDYPSFSSSQWQAV
jgi:transposase